MVEWFHMDHKTTSIVESPRQINLTLPFTIEDVREMIASVDDDRDWQLVVTYSGTAYLCDRAFVGDRSPPKLREYPDGVEFGDPRLAEDRELEAERRKILLAEGSDLIYLRLEAWIQGNGYAGREAAADDDWVRWVYQVLQGCWPSPSSAVAPFVFY